METKFLTMRYYLEPTLIGEDSVGSFWAIDAVSPSAFSPGFGDDFEAARPLTAAEVATLQILQTMEQKQPDLESMAHLKTTSTLSAQCPAAALLRSQL